MQGWAAGGAAERLRAGAHLPPTALPPATQPTLLIPCSSLCFPSPLQKYEELKQLTVQAERYMLRAFGFVVHVEHPHRFILNYCQMLMKPRCAGM